MRPTEVRNFIRLSRVARRFTQFGRGRVVGVSHAHISCIEVSYSKPSPGELERLAAILNLPELADRRSL